MKKARYRFMVLLISVMFITVAVYGSDDALVSGITIEEFNSVVDFTASLKTLNNLTSVDELKGRFLIISGEVAARQVVDRNEETFVAELELVDGEWKGYEEVLIYRCFVILDGKEFYGTVPARRTRQKNPKEIDLNSTLLVVAQLEELREIDDGIYVPVIRALYIRSLG